VREESLASHLTSTKADPSHKIAAGPLYFLGNIYEDEEEGEGKDKKAKKAATLKTRTDKSGRPTPEALLEGYNLALAQACLLKAREVRIELVGVDAKRVRALIRELKFRRILFVAERLDEGFKLTLDGPLSLFKQTSRYGLQLALFLPALTRSEHWSLAADLSWTSGPSKPRPVTLKLSEASPISRAGVTSASGRAPKKSTSSMGSRRWSRLGSSCRTPRWSTSTGAMS